MTSISRPLWTKEFIFICLVTFLAYANNSVFFSFYEYLKTLNINPESYGLLIAAFSGVSLIIRPVLSPFVHPGNARAYLFIGTLMVILTLGSYSLAFGFSGLLMVRIFHGIAFVIMGTALMALTIDFIPRKRSAQVFGLLAIIILIPNTIIPPILPFLNRTMGGFTGMLLFFALITLMVFPLIKSLKPKAKREDAPDCASALTGQEILENIKNPRILALLAIMLLFFSTHALVFFFLDGFGRSIGIVSTGFFMTLATVSEIGVRLGAGTLFDKWDKCLLSAGALSGLTLAYALLGHVHGTVSFFLMGGTLGLGWGIAMPVFNGLMFDISLPRFRAFNLNLGLQMFQGGFFLGPFIGGAIAARWGFTTLFNACAAMSFSALIVTFFLRSQLKK